MTIALKDMKARLLADPEVRAEYDRLGPEFEIANTLVRARAKAGLSQQEIAERMGTTQSAVARIESGRASLKTETIHRYAAAIGCRAEFKLVPAERAATAKPGRRRAPQRAAGNKRRTAPRRPR